MKTIIHFKEIFTHQEKIKKNKKVKNNHKFVDKFRVIGHNIKTREKSKLK